MIRFHEAVYESKSDSLLQHLDLVSFKVNPCYNRQTHSHKQCPYFHSKKDRRRPLANVPEMCTAVRGEDGDMCQKQECLKSHSKVEQLYSQSRYKTKFCTHYPNDCKNCEYGEYCSFAHDEIQIRIELIHHYSKDQDFFIFHYKTLWCPFNYLQHDRSKCFYAHNWQDFRRKNTEFSYDPVSCSHWNPNNFITAYQQGCRNGFQCKKCHGWKQLEYHPRNYKTRPCTQKRCNKGETCPYFHRQEQKRIFGQKIKGRVFSYYPRNRGAKLLQGPSHENKSSKSTRQHSQRSYARKEEKQQWSEKESMSSLSSRSSKNNFQQQQIDQMVSKLLE